MKTQWYLALVSVLVFCMLVQAQTYVPGGGNYPAYAPSGYYGYDSLGASTAGEGYARGIGEVIRAQGAYNLATSTATINLSEARRRQIENDKLWTQTYFETREINRQAREAERKRQRGNPEDWVRYAQAGKPKPLSNNDLDAITGKIRWPILLTDEQYNAQRAELEKAFADRAYHGILGSSGFLKVTHVTEEMMVSMKSQIRSFPPEQYVAAKRFLESLAYEAGLPAG